MDPVPNNHPPHHRPRYPPAWTDVWTCPSPLGHIQVTGRDARGRKQYRYHESWRESRDRHKYLHMIEFARALPKIRRQLQLDLRKRDLPREKVVAAIVQLLETTLIRIGNDAYARTNQSFGLSTIRNRHVRVKAGCIEFNFRGKSGKDHHVILTDPLLARIVRRCQDLPGQKLFCYRDGQGMVHQVNSNDVNSYLHSLTGTEITAKDFRTWNGTKLAAIALSQLGVAENPTAIKRNMAQAICEVAGSLRNTAAICRKCYIHPAILSAYAQGRTIPLPKERESTVVSRLTTSLSKVEKAVLRLIETQATLDHRK